MSVTLLTFPGSLAKRCASLKQLSKVRPRFFYINSNEPLYYWIVVNVNKCGGSCNTIDDPHAQIFVSDKVENVNVMLKLKC